MFHPFIKEYFKDNLDSIKEFHNKVNNKVNNNDNDNNIYTIYFEDDNYYAIKNNDPTTKKHITMFFISDILNMCIATNVNQTDLENFILSII